MQIVAAGLQRTAHVRTKRSLEGQVFAGHGMGERQTGRVKHLASDRLACQPLRAAVQGVADKGMPRFGHVRTDLMGTSGGNLDLEKAGRREALPDAEAGDGILAAGRHRFNPVALAFTSEHGADFPDILLGGALDEGQI